MNFRSTHNDDEEGKPFGDVSPSSFGPPLGQPLKSGKIPVEFRGRTCISRCRSSLRFVSAKIYSLAADLDSGAPFSVSEPHPFAGGCFQPARRNGVHAVLRGRGLPKILRAVIEEVAALMVNDPEVSKRQSIRDCENNAMHEDVFVRHLHAKSAIRMGAPCHVPGELVIPCLR